jgi:O-antigen ligase
MKAFATSAERLAAPRVERDVAMYAPAIATAAVIVSVGVASGGFRPAVWRLATVLLCLLAAAALMRLRVELWRRELIMLIALGGYAAWNAVSSVWSITPSSSALEAERSFLYVAAVAAVVLAVGRADVGSVVGGAIAGITIVAAVGLGQHYLTVRPLDPVEGRLLIEPLGYSNALGLWASIGIVLAVGATLASRTASHRKGTASHRKAALASCLVLVPTLLLTSSRGAAAALAIGLAAVLYFSGKLRSRALLVTILLVGVAAGLILGTNRNQSLSPVGENRPHYWHVAVDEYVAHPVLGGGAGTFGDYFWRYHRPHSGFAREAHSLYLQTLAELGPGGLALLLVALGVPLARMRTCRDPITGTAGGAYIAFLAHAAIDWDWQIPALTLVGLLCGALVLVSTRQGHGRTVSRRVRNAGVALAVVAALFAFAQYLTGPGLA